MNFPPCSLPEFLETTPVTQQKKLVLSIIFVIIIISSNPTNSQSLSSSSPTDNNSKSSHNSTNSFNPNLAIFLGVLSIILSLILLCLIYAKIWHTPSYFQYLNQEHFGVLPRSVNSRVSGVDKTVVESLPFFRFSTLKGWRNGLECSICLSRFEDIEVLRLLPKCKHAFHIGCVDQWLEKHSGCPLCRCEVNQEDATHFANSSSFRFLSNKSAREGSNLELFVEREGSRRFGSGRSAQKVEEILEDDEMLHKFNHRIIISGYYEHNLMGKNRWSNLSSSDLLFLKSEMITSSSSNFFADDQEMVASMSSNKLDPYPPITRTSEVDERIKFAQLGEERSMSEIVIHPRFLGVESRNKEVNLGEIRGKEERVKRLWVSIARRTITMFGGRDEA